MQFMKIPGGRVWVTVLFFFFCGFDALSGVGSAAAAGGSVHVIPEPVSVVEKPGSFMLRQGAHVAVEGDSAGGLSGWLIGAVREQTGLVLREEKGSRGVIVVQVDKNADKRMGLEGYSLTVSSSG